MNNDWNEHLWEVFLDGQWPEIAAENGIDPTDEYKMSTYFETWLESLSDDGYRKDGE